MGNGRKRAAADGGSRPPTPRNFFAAAAWLLPLVVFIYFLCPTIAAGDSAELITCAATLGVPHPPGYPTFTMVGKLFTFIPLGSVAWRVNLMSAVFDSLACLMLFLTLRRLTRNPWSALAAAWGLAFSRLFWHYSEVAEVFALNNFFATAIIYVLIKWREAALAQGRGGGIPAPRLLFVLSFLCGLALTNQQTIVAIFPAVLYLLLVSWPPLCRDPRMVLRLFFCLLLGLGPYLYLPLAAAGRPAINWDDPTTLTAFAGMLLRTDYGSLSLLSAETGMGAPSRLTQLLSYAHGLYDCFTPFGLVLIGIGMLRLRAADACGSRVDPIQVFLWIAFMMSGPVFVLAANMPVQDRPLLLGVLHRFYILSTVILACGLGLGAATVLDFAARRWPKRLTGPLLAVSLAVVLMWANHEEADFRDNYLAYDLGCNTLSCMAPDALFFSRGDLVTMAVDYLQLVEGRRPDVVMLDQEKMTYAWFYRQVRERHPEVRLAGERYDGTVVFNVALIDENLARYPHIYFSDFKEDSYRSRFEAQPNGLVQEIVSPAHERTVDALGADNLRLFRGFVMRGLRRPYPRTSLEAQIQKMYADVCKSTASLLMSQNSVPGEEVAELLVTALELNPSDPAAEQMRAAVRKLQQPGRPR